MKFSDVFNFAVKELMKRKFRTIITILIIAIGVLAVGVMNSIYFPLEQIQLKAFNDAYPNNAVYIYPINYKNTKISTTLEQSIEANTYTFKGNNILDTKDFNNKNLLNNQALNNIQKSINAQAIEGINTMIVSNVKVDGKVAKSPMIFTVNKIGNEVDELSGGSMGLNSKLIAGKQNSENSVMVSLNLLNKLGIRDYKNIIGKEITISEINKQGEVLYINKIISGIYKNNPYTNIYPTQMIPMYNKGIHSYYQVAMDSSYKPDIIANNNVYKSLVDFIGKNNLAEYYDYAIAVPKNDNISNIDRYSIQYNNGFTTGNKTDSLVGIVSSYQGISGNFSFCGYIVLVLAMLLFIVSMGMNVEQRVKWYAIMRSIGLTKKSMKRLVLLQSIIIGAIGYVLGVITSTIVVEVLKTNFMTMNMSFMLSPAIYIVSAIAVLFITFLTYIIISFKLDRLDIIEAIARE